MKSGDTIARIAAAYGVGAEDLIKLNDLRAAGGHPCGAELEDSGGGTPVAQTPEAPKPVALQGFRVDLYGGARGYAGEHRSEAARGYDDLIRLNKIEDPRKLKIGLKLKVPAKRTKVG